MLWMTAAWADVGEQEISGSDANPKILGYFRSVGRDDIASDEVAWCAAFAGRCLEGAGVSLDKIPQAERLLANSYLKIGQPIDDLRVGALCVLSRGSDPAQGHVGFVTGWTETDVVLLGGNQGNKVSTQHFARSRIRGVRWPAPAVTAAQVEKQGSRIAVASKRNQVDGALAAVLEGSKQALDVAPPPPTAAAADMGAQFLTFCAHKWPVIAIALQVYVLAGLVYRSGLIRAFRAEDASTGKTQGGAA